jgi:hypothetical protein
LLDLVEGVDRKRGVVMLGLQRALDGRFAARENRLFVASRDSLSAPSFHLGVRLAANPPSNR